MLRVLLAVGIDRIAQQVQQHLLQEDRVDPQQGQAGSGFLNDLHLVLRRLPGAKPHRFMRQHRSVHLLQPARALAQKTAQAANHSRRMLGLLTDACQPMLNAFSFGLVTAKLTQIALTGSGII